LYYQPKFPLLKNLAEDTFILGFFTPPLSIAIKSLKYQSLHRIGPILGDLLYTHVWLPADIDCVTAVPLHPKRFRVRGYNQAELIARQLAQRLGKPYEKLLVRQQHTQNLASTESEKERFRLMKNAFRVNPFYSGEIRGKNILLIDDVITTGSTVAACATALKKIGANKIYAAALAHEG
jgi:ComF family protein